MKQHFRSVWTREPRTAKSPGLDRAQIVREAMALLDAEGLDALSMRRLGARLGSGATSIYWHVANKDELLELVLDEVYGELTVLDVQETSWRDSAAFFAYSMRQMLFRHPWVINLIGTVPGIGPNAILLMTWLVATFDHAGFRGLDQDYAASTLMAYVSGITMPELSWRTMMERTGLDSNELNAALHPMVEKAAAGHPELVARHAGLSDIDVETTRALNFDFGLTCLLDGLEARLNRAAPTDAPPSEEAHRDATPPA